MTIILDAGCVGALAGQRALLVELRRRGHWPAQVPAVVLTEALTGDVTLMSAAVCSTSLDCVTPSRTCWGNGLTSSSAVLVSDEPFRIQLIATAQRCLHRLPAKIVGRASLARC
jgi:hypothetical protein